MALTILIKFCGFIVHSKPKNMTLSVFPGKIPETRKIVFIFCSSLNVAPKPTGQSRSHSICRVPLQISLAHFFRFRPTPKIKGSWPTKKILIFLSSKMAPTIFIKFCGFIAHSNLINMALSAFPEKSLKLEKYFLIFYLLPNVAPKSTNKSCSNSIFRALLQLSPAHHFYFRPTPNIKIP